MLKRITNFLNRNKEIQMTAEQNAEICTNAFMNENYATGLEALSELGKAPEVYLMQMDALDKPVYSQAYAEFVRIYFDVNPEKVSHVLFENQKKVKDNKDAKLFRANSFYWIEKLSYELINCEIGPEVYKNDTVKRLTLGSNNLTALITWNEKAETISAVSDYSTRLVREGAYSQAMKNYDTILTREPKSLFNGGTYRGPLTEHYDSKELANKFGKSFMQNLIFSAAQADEAGRNNLDKLAEKHKDVLDTLIVSGYNQTRQAMKPFDQRITNEASLKIQENLMRVKGLLKQNVA